ncbi:uncharacterized protein LOC100746661 [Bombus impatiens]|uniref:Uncharacterized protein LOC100746661 n=1 Tax=Bombus impatiens TaxID=132113 RepID=A0A6P8LRS8_BOMIM|nr:uncharacterized protein LOC100746661 [Bombus impatiens]
MKYKCSRVFLSYVVLCTATFSAASENQTVITTAIKNRIRNPLSELLQDDLPIVLQSLQLYTTSAEKEIFNGEDRDSGKIKNEVEEDNLKLIDNSKKLSKREVTDSLTWEFSKAKFEHSESSPQDPLESNSCETQAASHGHRHRVGIIVHEYFCELNKFFHYVVDAGQSLKPESPFVHLLNITEDAILFTELEDLPELIEIGVTRLEAILKHPEKLETLLNIIRKSFRIVTPILKSVIRLKGCTVKFITHIQDLFNYFKLDYEYIVGILKEFENKVFTFINTALSFIYGCILNPIEEIANLFSKAIAWLETTIGYLIDYVQQKFYRHLSLLEEAIDILQAFYNGYTASGFSETLNIALQVLGLCKNPTTSGESLPIAASSQMSQSSISGLLSDEKN